MGTNTPLAFVDWYIAYRAIAMDVGDKDGLRVDAGKLHDVPDNYGIANSLEIYPGTHTSAVADRFQNHVMHSSVRTSVSRPIVNKFEQGSRYDESIASQLL